MHRSTSLLRFYLTASIILSFLLPGPVQAQDEPVDLPAIERHRPYGYEAITGIAPHYPENIAESNLAAEPSSPTVPTSDWDRIVYQSYKNNNWEIYLAHSDGSDPLQLTNHPAADVYPRLNRGGTRIAFASSRDGNYEIYAMGPDGTAVSRLTRSKWDEYTPAWSPDSSKIVYVTAEKGSLDLAVMSADGTEQRLLTNDGTPDFGPVWSPDGSQIAWVRQDGYFGQIWLMNADGSNPQPLSDWLVFLENLSWSPDGTRIAFDCDGNGDGWTELGWINSNGSGLEIFYEDNLNSDYLMGSWSPQGTRMIISIVNYYPPYEGVTYAYQSLLATRMLTDGYVYPFHYPTLPVFEMYPDWQTIDISAPTSQVKQVEQFTRAKGVHIEWSAVDNGPAGVASYDVQVRVGKSGIWTDWQMGTIETSAVYTGTGGSQVYFRSRARDQAGNVEAWPGGDGDADTTLFTWLVKGKIMDARGYPLPRTPLGISPAPLGSTETGSLGNYLARLIAGGAHTLQASRPGFGTLPAAQRDIHSDQALNLALPPAENRIVNGVFDGDQLGLGGWSLAGTPAVITATAAHTGSGGLLLGQYCPAPCLVEPEQVANMVIPGMTLENWTGMVFDKEGVGHLVWAAGGNLFYNSLSPTGDWSETVDLGPGMESHQLLVDEQNTLHLLSKEDTYSQGQKAYYRQKPKAGSWSKPFDLGGCGTPQMTVDRQGKAYVFYYGAPAGALYYRVRSLAGSWSPPEEIGFGLGNSKIGVAATPDGIIHFVWPEYPNITCYRSRFPDGTLSPTKVMIESASSNPYLRTTPAGELYLFWSQYEDFTYSLQYMVRSPGGDWSWPYTLGGMHRVETAVIDPQGTIHLRVTAADMDDRNMYYISKKPDETWSDPVVLPKPNYTPGYALTADTNGRLHQTWINIAVTDADRITAFVEHQSAPQAEADQVISVSQAVEVPAEMHAPTLSFEYALEGVLPGGSTAAAVWAESNQERLQLRLLDGTQEWQHAWVDLSAWAGETVTVTFVLEQAGGEQIASLHLDEIALGAWLTPVVTGVSPDPLEDPAGALITITGHNFLAGASVMAGNIPLDKVQYIDEHTLMATIPSGLRAGIYDLWVTNPGGQANLLPGGLRLGKTVFLPAVHK